MSDDISIPDFLNRKLNPVADDRKASQLRYMPKEGLVWPPVRDWKAKKPVEGEEENILTPGEQDYLLEIKAMAKTNLLIAKQMAAGWMTADRKACVRRRRALHTINGLLKHRRDK